jgi:hypothetical protein
VSSGERLDGFDASHLGAREHVTEQHELEQPRRGGT